MLTNPPVPPQSIECEQQLLGSLILGCDSVPAQVISMVKVEHFYRADHREIYRAILSLFDQNVEPDMAAVVTELRQRGKLDEVGGVDYLVGLAESVGAACNGIYYASVIKEKYVLREYIRLSDKLSDLAYDITDAKEIAEFLDKEILQITDESVLHTIPEPRGSVNRVLVAIKNPSCNVGINTGFDDLDRLVGGLKNSELVILASRPSMGKSAMAANIVEHVATRTGAAIAVFSLEMSSDSLWKRMLCSRAEVSEYQIRNGYLSATDIEKLDGAAEELSQTGIYIDDSAQLTPTELRAKSRWLKQRHNIELIVIDYLQLLHVPGAKDDYQRVSTISRQLKTLAGELRLPVLALSQLNRQVEARENHQPRLSDLRESGALEQDADVVLLLHRTDYYGKDNPKYQPNNLGYLSVSKNRNGPTGLVKLVWDSEHVRFLPAAKGV